MKKLQTFYQKQSDKIDNLKKLTKKSNDCALKYFIQEKIPLL